MAIDHQTNNSHPLSTYITRSTRPLPQMKYSLDDWPKTGKRPMTVTIIDTSPPVTKLMAIKDFLMIYLWDIISGQVAGNAIEFSRRARSHHHGAEERLRADPADGHRHLHGEPRWHLHRPRRHQGHLGIQHRPEQLHGRQEARARQARALPSRRSPARLLRVAARQRDA